MLYYENFDLEHIITPIDAVKLDELLTEAGYFSKKAFIVEGFKFGFPLHYEGETNIQRSAPNLKLRVGSKTELWNKVMKEVQVGRYAGPFKEPPFKNYIQSPIGLVPKDKGTKTRLIFHLSYPKNVGTSVNACIPKKYCSVHYPDFEEALKMCIKAGLGAKIGKSDLSSAFRHLPMRV